jgi:hypothetical protein
MPLGIKTLEELALLNSATGPIANALIPPGLTPATGTIQLVGGSSLIEGETVTITDATGTAYTYEFNKSGGAGVDPANYYVNTSDAFDNLDMSFFLAQAINGSPIATTAVDGGAGTTNLTQDGNGGAGNVQMTETVADGGFSTDGMSGATELPMVMLATNGDGIDTSAVTRCVVSVKTSGGDVVFDVVGRTENVDNKFEVLNNLKDLDCFDGRGWKELVVCSTEDEIGVVVTSVTNAFITSIEIVISPCPGGV